MIATMQTKNKLQEMILLHSDSVFEAMSNRFNSKKNSKKIREGVGGPSHEKMLERSRRYRENHIFTARERALRWDREHPEKRMERYRRWKARQQEVLCKPL